MVTVSALFTAIRYGYKIFKYGYKAGQYVGSKRSLRTIAKDAIITGASGGIFGGSYTAFEFARDVYNDNKKAPRNSTTYVVMFPTTNRTASTSYSRVGSARTVRLFP